MSQMGIVPARRTFSFSLAGGLARAVGQRVWMISEHVGEARGPQASHTQQGMGKTTCDISRDVETLRVSTRVREERATATLRCPFPRLSFWFRGREWTHVEIKCCTSRSKGQRGLLFTMRCTHAERGVMLRLSHMGMSPRSPHFLPFPCEARHQSRPSVSTDPTRASVHVLRAASERWQRRVKLSRPWASLRANVQSYVNGNFSSFLSSWRPISCGHSDDSVT